MNKKKQTGLGKRNHSRKMLMQAMAASVAVGVLVPAAVAELPGFESVDLGVGKAEAASFASGTGTISDPYVISTAMQLNQVRNHASSHFKLGADMDLTGLSWIAIPSFTGTFDGDGKTIKGLSVGSLGFIDSLSKAVVKNVTFKDSLVDGSLGSSGMLARKSENSTIENVHVENSRITSKAAESDACGLVGQAVGTSVTSSTVTDTYVAGARNSGGLIGFVEKEAVTKILDSRSTADVGNSEGGSSAGGLIGHSMNVFISNSFASGAISCKGNAGGLVGKAEENTTIKDSESSVEVKGEYAGGLVGSGAISSRTDSFKIKDSSASVNIDATYAAGGVVGSLHSTSNTVKQEISNVRTTGVVKADRDGGGIVGQVSSMYTNELVAFISNSHSATAVTATSYTGGLIGNAGNVIIEDSSSSGNVTGVGNVGLSGIAGGLAGIVNGAIIERSYATGEVRTARSGGVAGGLIGRVWSRFMSSTISDSYATGDVIGYNASGGFVGDIRESKIDSFLSNIYATGSVSSHGYAGGLIGETDTNSTVTVTNAFALNKSVNGSWSSGMAIGKFQRSSIINNNNIRAFSGMTGDGHDDYVLSTLNPTQLMKEMTYAFSGFEFGDGGDAIWAIEEDVTLPYLVANPHRTEYDPEVGWKPEKPVDVYDDTLYQTLLTELNSMYASILANTLPKEDVLALEIRAKEAQTEADAITKAEHQSEIKLLADQNIELILALKALWAAIDSGNVDEIEDAVNKLPESPVKEQVKQEVEEVQTESDNLATATTAVVNAESTKLQKDVAAARVLVDGLKESPEKTSLTKRLDTVQAAIDTPAGPTDLDNAQEAVGNLGDKPTQDDINKAQEAVDKLPEGPDKEDLQGQIDAAQDKLDKENQANQDKAEEEVGNLGDNPTQDDIDKAKDAVDKLPDGPTKDDLQQQIDNAQKVVDEANRQAAQDLIDGLGDNPTKEEIQAVQDAINKLPSGPVKNDLQGQLDDIKKSQADYDKTFGKAVAAVEQAEKFPTNYNLNKAEAALAGLPEGKDKQDLQDRLDVVKAELAMAEVEKLVAQAEKYQRETYVTKAQAAITDMAPSDTKDAFQARLDIVKAAMNAADVAKAVTAATTQVERAEKYQRDPYFTNAQEAIDAISDEAAREPLQARLDAARLGADNAAAQKEVDNATAKVEQAEKYKRDPYLTDAKALVDALPASEVKTALETRVENLFAEVGYDGDIDKEFNELYEKMTHAEAKKLIKTVHNGVVRAEKYKKGTHISYANRKYDEFLVAYPVGYEDILKVLKDRIEAVEQFVASVDPSNPDGTPDTRSAAEKKAEDAVDKAEQYETKSRIRTAQGLVDALEDGEFKTEMQERLDFLTNESGEAGEQLSKEELKAQDDVEKAEQYKTNSRIKTAQKSVDALTDGGFKADLQDRLDTLVASKL